MKGIFFLAAVQGAAAFWRMPCRGQIGLARLDPLVNPNEVAQHVHAIHGSSGFSMNASYEDLMAGDCTSCGVTQDKSVYWAPALYFKHAEGGFELVDQIGGMLNYYFLNKDPSHGPDGKITAFPPGFRMIAGDSLRRNYSIAGLSAKDRDPEKSLWKVLGQTTQVDLEQRALGFNCLNYGKTPEGSLYRHYLPEKSYLDENCADGVRFEIMFPACWDGKNLDSHNHRSHVAYPDLVMGGSCPPGYPVVLPGLFYETIWATNAFRGKAGEFVISNGDSDGFGYHADFMNGWNEAFLQQAVDTCTNMSGRIEDCPIFDIQPEEAQRNCKMEVPSVLANEKVAGAVGDLLPGGVPIQYGPAPATAANPGPRTTTVEHPSVGYSEGVKPTDTLYQPGQIFREHTTSPAAEPTPKPTPASEPEVGALAQPAVTAAPEPPVVEEDGEYAIVRTEWHTEGRLVNMVIVKEKIEYVTMMTTTATSTVTVNNLRARYEPHMHRHGRRHVHGRRS
jgi:hypothetical protein